MGGMPNSARSEVVVVGHVGADPLGEWVRAELAADGVDLTGLGVDPTGTARSVNLMAADGSRINFYDGRGHLDLTVDPAGAAGLFAGTRFGAVPPAELGPAPVAGIESFPPPPVDLPIVDTNGAGDALVHDRPGEAGSSPSGELCSVSSPPTCCRAARWPRRCCAGSWARAGPAPSGPAARR